MRVYEVLVQWGLVLVLELLSAPVRAEIQVQDDRGQTLRLAQPAKRILALPPHAVEILFEIGAGDRLLARPSAATYPDAAARLPSLGDGVQLDSESLLAFKPDLIVAWDTAGPRKALMPLIAMGIPVYWSDPAKLADIARTMRNLGQLTNETGRAELAAQAFERSLEAWRRIYLDKTPRPKLLYVIWPQPWMTINSKHFISEMFNLCSADNLFADLPQLAPQISLESILARQPDMVLSGESRSLKIIKGFPQVPANQYQAVLLVNPDWFERPGPRVLEALGSLCPEVDRVRRLLH